MAISFQHSSTRRGQRGRDSGGEWERRLIRGCYWTWRSRRHLPARGAARSTKRKRTWVRHYIHCDWPRYEREANMLILCHCDYFYGIIVIWIEAIWLTTNSSTCCVKPRFIYDIDKAFDMKNVVPLHWPTWHCDVPSTLRLCSASKRVTLFPLTIDTSSNRILPNYPDMAVHGFPAAHAACSQVTSSTLSWPFYVIIWGVILLQYHRCQNIDLTTPTSVRPVDRIAPTCRIHGLDWL